MKLLAILALTLLLSVNTFAKTKPSTYAVLVDKKTNELELVRYENGVFAPVKVFHATLGRVTGDKEEEGDLKTPDGIYVFKSKQTPPQLAAKFGIMGLSLNYPNAFDDIAGHTGSGIMLHATNEPDRLKKDYDSQGCVVLNNEEIRDVDKYIRLGLTPILIFQELTDEYRKPGLYEPLKKFFESWYHTWETKDLNDYINHYHSNFSAQGKNKEQWKAYKRGLNQRYAKIEINPEDIHFYRHPKYSMITFTQNYHSTLKNGRKGHVSRGTKILYVAEEAGQLKIISETYSNLMW